jgi:RNA polymerase-binding transcription factor
MVFALRFLLPTALNLPKIEHKYKEGAMPDENAGLGTEFVERQRKRLETLRDQLSGTAEAEAGQGRLRDEDADRPWDWEDEGALTTQRETDEALHDATERRLRDVERALEKIEEGTYGLSDASGQPIPQARLENVPEAIYTVEEEKRREGGSPILP